MFNKIIVNVNKILEPSYIGMFSWKAATENVRVEDTWMKQLSSNGKSRKGQLRGLETVFHDISSYHIGWLTINISPTIEQDNSDYSDEEFDSCIITVKCYLVLIFCYNSH